MNTVTLIGNLSNDVTLQYTPQTQTAVAKFTLAVNRPKKDGQDQGADFIRVVVWGRQAETCNQYLAKGRKCAVLGHITTGSYKDKDGKTVYTTDVTADRIEFLGGNVPAAQGMPQPVAQETLNGTGFTQAEEPLPWEQ